MLLIFCYLPFVIVEAKLRWKQNGEGGGEIQKSSRPALLSWPRNSSLQEVHVGRMTKNAELCAVTMSYLSVAPLAPFLCCLSG
jgi:hypothetical protein